MAQMMSELAPGETIEIPEAYIGQNQKLTNTCHDSSFNRRSNGNTSKKPSYT